jgi:hypothetical protein
MSDVDRMYRHLVRTIRAGFPQFLTEPFELGELYQTILPYRLHRRELGLETNSDYEHTLLELLDGPAHYMIIDDRLRDVLQGDRNTGAPEPARIREFASTQVRLAPDALAKIDATPAATATVTRSAVSAPVRAADRPSTATSRIPSEAPPRRVTKPIVIPDTGANCQFCKGELPPGRQIAYCPHCGQDVTVAHCPACGSELERDWKFCVTCGRGLE